MNRHVLLPLNDLKLLIYQRYSQFKMRDEPFCLVFRTACSVHIFLFVILYLQYFCHLSDLYLPHLCAEFVTASAGSKVLAKLSELKGLFDRVCLIIEEDPVREGRRKTAYVSPDSF